MVAEAAGVSVASVSMALRGDPQISPARRDELRALAESMGYRTNPVLAAGMAQVRHRKEADIGGVLLGLHSLPLKEAQVWEATRNILDGLSKRAGELGYRVEWAQLLPEQEKRLIRRIGNMGIPGAVFIGPRWPALDEALARIAEHISVVRASGTREGVKLHFAQIDFYRGVMVAMERALKDGARRIGLVTSRRFDEATGKAISGAYYASQPPESLSEELPPLFDPLRERFDERVRGWWRKYRPDAILTTEKNWTMEHWRSLSPGQCRARMIQIGVTSETPDWEGIRFPDDLVGVTAVDMVVAQIHRGERGVPHFQKGTLVEGAWISR